MVTYLFYMYVVGLCLTLFALRNSYTRLAKFLSGPFPEFIGWCILGIFLLVYPVFYRRLRKEDVYIRREITRVFQTHACMTVEQQMKFREVFGSEYNYMPVEIIEASSALRNVAYLSLPTYDILTKTSKKGYITTSDFIQSDIDHSLYLGLLKTWTSKNRGKVYQLTTLGTMYYKVAKKLKFS